MTPENTPPVLYALWNDEHGYYIDAGNRRPRVATDLKCAETLASLLTDYRIVTLTPSLEVRGE